MNFPGLIEATQNGSLRLCAPKTFGAPKAFGAPQLEVGGDFHYAGQLNCCWQKD